MTATTTPAPSNVYSPRHVVVVWAQTADGAFVKTIGRYSAERTQHLVAWRALAGVGDADAVSGATRQSHQTPISFTWNLRDKTGALVPDGTYTIRMELAESNANQPTQNNQGTFTFVKGAAPQVQSALSNGGFTNVTLDFQPVADTCNNGVVDNGETCDSALAGSCPVSCPASADACMPNNLVGNAASCTAACTVQPVTECIAGDGCCADGCTAATDADCEGDGGGGGGSTDLTGGCTVGSDGGLAVFALLGAFVLLRRRRQG